MFFLRQLRKIGVNMKILIQFSPAVTESVLTFWISIWYGSVSVHDQKLLDGLVRVASKLTGCELPSPESIYTTRTQRKVRCITADEQHPAHYLLQCLSSGRYFRTIKMRTSRFENSFYPKAVQIVSPVPSTSIQWYSDRPSASLTILTIPFVVVVVAICASKTFALVTSLVLLLVYFYLVVFYYF